ncbi:hypothetical protein FJY90_02090 [Candidatus Gottesmanbacteria bacterium]|nr:hypothetical protein [Candidatus Gottesmanbacteria bacterium]
MNQELGNSNIRSNLTTKQKVNLIILLGIVIALPIGVYLVGQQQELRKRAEGTREVDLRFDPPSGEKHRGDTFSTIIKIFKTTDRSIKASGIQAVINVSNKINIGSIVCQPPFDALPFIRINGQSVTMMCSIAIGVNPPELTSMGQAFTLLNFTVKNDAEEGDAPITFTSTRVTEAGISGQAPDVSTGGQPASFTVVALIPTLSPTPTISASATPIPTLSPTLPPFETPTPTITVIISPTITISPIPTSSPTISPTTLLTPSPVTSLTPTPSNCPLKSEGDADCNNSIDENDYFIWKCEFIGNGKCSNSTIENRADFNQDGKVTLTDFEFWRRSFYSPQGQ